ncbi:hypothetical protein [Hymenobacter edaphi]|uniref:Uncharacterized protein n=1 Tax=Hymenobacter edaphi TaxID=2211146 RepID=A0A328BCJ5_9BACT|nr:hypothetical protein [Hymenobacter edaphi]RAK63524.1 hypothetical protein DLM85_21220 [Hymenobacter edaphi]
MRIKISLLLAVLCSCGAADQPAEQRAAPDPVTAARPGSAANILDPNDPHLDPEIKAELMRTSRPGRLARSIIESAALDSLAALDAVACRSDGEESEEVGIACDTLWEAKLPLFVGYLQQHPRSCLQNALIDALSSRFITSENRAQAIAAFKQKSTERAARLGLSRSEKTLLQQITAAIDPARFD